MTKKTQHFKNPVILIHILRIFDPIESLDLACALKK